MRQPYLKAKVALGLVLLMLGLSSVSAIDVDPRDYIAAPPGTDLSIVYAGHLSSKHGSDLEADLGIYRYVKYIDWLGMTVDPQFLIPVGDVELDSADLRAKGFADPIFAATFWVINDAKTRTYLGITPFLIPPWGHYQRGNPLSLGQNRWRVIPQVGFVQGLSDKTFVELVGDVTFYGDNTDFNRAGERLAQAPSLQVQLLVSHSWRENVYFGANLSYEDIGENTLAGVDLNDPIERTKLSIYAVNWLTKQHQLQVKYSRDLHADKAIETHQLQLRWTYVF